MIGNSLVVDTNIFGFILQGSETNSEFLEDTVIHTNNLIARLAVNFRKSYNIKLPDAIIAATASFQIIPLFTADKELFKIAEINIIEFYP